MSRRCMSLGLAAMWSTRPAWGLGQLTIFGQCLFQEIYHYWPMFIPGDNNINIYTQWKRNPNNCRNNPDYSLYCPRNPNNCRPIELVACDFFKLISAFDWSVWLCQAATVMVMGWCNGAAAVYEQTKSNNTRGGLLLRRDEQGGFINLSHS